MELERHLVHDPVRGHVKPFVGGLSIVAHISFSKVSVVPDLGPEFFFLACALRPLSLAILLQLLDALVLEAKLSLFYTRDKIWLTS